jgi:hypothetical protein
VGPAAAPLAVPTSGAAWLRAAIAVAELPDRQVVQWERPRQPLALIWFGADAAQYLTRSSSA